MKSLISTASAVVLLLLLVCASAAFSADQHEHNKVVCYWNTTSFHRTHELAKFQIDDIKPALGLCTHLIYGFAGFAADTFRVQPLDERIDLRSGASYYVHVPQLKRQFPDLKVYLSIGGNADPNEDTHKYLTVTETSNARNKFINSAVELLHDYDFDGLDLAWQFPPTLVKKERGVFKSLWHGLKKTLGQGKFEDDKESEHRDGFTIMVRELKSQLRSKNKFLTLSVLPHVNSSVYYDVPAIEPHLDAVHLLAFDQANPDRTPKKADYPAPIKYIYPREVSENIEGQTRYWLSNKTPGSKIVVGIPTFARSWKLGEGSAIAGSPPVEANGPDEPGPQLGSPGLLSYIEVCARVPTDRAKSPSESTKIRRVNDPSKSYGSYAYRAYDNGQDGFWMGYEDPETAGTKATYVKSNGLGGVAIYDLSLDDFRGNCNGEKFPILKGAKNNL